MKNIKGWIGLVVALSISEAQAVTQEIRASFQPDPSQPAKNEFRNLTPNSGYCVLYPSICAGNNIFSIELPVRYSSSRAIVPGEGIPLKAPANWRQLMVTNRDSQETETVEVRITGVGSTLVLSDTSDRLTGAPTYQEGHDKLWTDYGWLRAPEPCRTSGLASFGPHSYRFFWKTPLEASCTKVAAFQIPSIYFEKLDFAYELRTPNPLGMSSGRYTGSLLYTLGPGADFDLGPLLNPDDSSLILDFVLDVQHTLKVDIPPGGNKVLLEPQGGWQSWLQQGRKPARLYRDQTFNISASSRFTMKLECEVELDGGCGIRDRVTGYGALVDVGVSLPSGLTDSSGHPVRRVQLSRFGTVPFQPGIYVDRKPGTLHFEVNASATSWLISNSQGRPFEGSITVVWDLEV